MTGTTERGEVLISQPLRVEHDHLNEESQARALKLAPMHVTNWEEAQGEDVLLAACRKWMSTKKNVSLQKRDALLRTCMGEHSDSEEGKALFRVRNTFTMKKGMLLRYHGVCLPLKPGSFQQTRVPHSLPMGVN